MSVSRFKDAQMHYLQGCSFPELMRLFWDNRKDLSLKHLLKISFVSFMSLILSPFALVENLIHSKKIKNTKIDKPPIFIVGHWRSGTTFLTNILGHDKNISFFTADKTYTHNTFLTLGGIYNRLYPKVLPTKRPMDNLAFGINEPAEEVFALGNNTKYSVVHMLSFPKRARFYARCAFYDDLNTKQKMRVKNVYDKVIKKLTYYTNQRLVIKSPDNTCRINMLLELYPDAKFIHIYRNPYKVVNSTIGMYNTLFPIFSFEDLDKIDKGESESVVLDIYEKLYKQYLVDKENIPPENLIEIKYEDFIKDPKGYMKHIYEGFELDDYDEVEKDLHDYIDSQKEYKTNPFNKKNINVKRINKHMRFLFNHYGYDIESPEQ